MSEGDPAASVSDGDPTLGGDTAFDVLSGGARRATWRERWSATAPRARLMSIVAALLTVAAVVVGSAAARAKPRYQDRIIDGPAAQAAATTDASGCPVGAQCLVRAEALPSLQAAFGRTFPGGRVLSAQRTDEVGSGRTYRAVLEGQVGAQAKVEITTECIPDSAPPADRLVSGASSHKDLGGNVVVDSRQVTVVVGGPPGCSVFLWLDAFDTRQRYELPAASLARDPSIQLGQ
ncbi:MAG: hypothetical protein ABJB98_06355 [Actinomycetota bacterium]